MVVFCRNYFVFDRVYIHTCDFEPFNTSIGSGKKVPIVDATVYYTFLYSVEKYVLIAINVLYVPSVDHNIITPVVIWEAIFNVRDTPKINFLYPESGDHAIKFPDYDLVISPSLWGIFSFFHTIIPTSYETQNKPSLFLVTDSISWKPYFEHYATHEESMVNWGGKNHESKYCKKRIIYAP